MLVKTYEGHNTTMRLAPAHTPITALGASAAVTGSPSFVTEAMGSWTAMAFTLKPARSSWPTSTT